MDDAQRTRLAVMTDPVCGVVAYSRVQCAWAQVVCESAALIREQSRIARYKSANTREQTRALVEEGQEVRRFERIMVEAIKG